MLLAVSFGITSNAFSAILLERDASVDVVDDSAGAIGLGVGTQAIGAGGTRELTTVTNRLNATGTVTVRLVDDDAGRLLVDGNQYGDTATLSGVGSGGARTFDVAVFCGTSAIGTDLTYEVTVSTDSIDANATRDETVDRLCVPWQTPGDWDGATSELGVVHEDWGVADHNDSDVELGYNATAPGLVAYYPLDEASGTTANDVSPNAYDGTTQNGPTLNQTGVLSTTAYEFGGNDVYVALGSGPDSASRALAGSGFTWSAWVQPQSIPNNRFGRNPIIAAQQGQNTRRFDLAITSGRSNTGQLTVYSADNGEISGGTLSNGEWYHVAVTVSNSDQIRLYLDGVEVTSGTTTSRISTSDTMNLARVGRSIPFGPYTFPATHYFNGVLDDPRFYNRSLSASAVADLARGTAPQSGPAVYEGSLTTDWTSTASIDVGEAGLTNVIATNRSAERVTLRVQSDTNADGVPNETSDPIVLNDSTGPYDVDGLSVHASRYRLVATLNTTNVTESPCLSSVVFAEEVDLVVGSDTAATGCNGLQVGDAPNQPPTAEFTYSPAVATAGQNVTIDAGASSDPDGDVAYYEWDFESDGTFERNTTSSTTEYAFPAAGTYDVTLRVVDNVGVADTTTKQVTVQQQSLRWDFAGDWDAFERESGVVHADFGDHDAGRVDLGVPASTGTCGVSYYPFDEDTGTTAADPLGGDTGTLEGGLATGQPGILTTTAYGFDGTDDYVNTSAALGRTLRNTSSLSVWIKTTQTGSDTMWQAPGITGVESNGDGNDVFWGWIDASGNIAIQGGNDAAATSTTAINDDTWHHVVFTYDDTTGRVEVYVDGELEDTATTRTAAITNDFSSIGRIEDTGGSPEYFQGSLDEVRTYDCVVTGSQVTDLYNNSAPAGVAWNGTQVTVDRSAEAAVDPTAINLTNVSATVPTGTNLTVYLQSDPDGDGTFEEESGPVALQTGTSEYTIPNGTLSNASSNYRLRVEFETSDVTASPQLDRVELDVPGGTANQPPNVAFTADPSTPGVSESVSFDAGGSSDSDGNVVGYDWQFGDGTTASGETATHSYAQPGRYTVTLTVTDDDGATNSTTRTVRVGTRWATAADWDAATASGVVHDSTGDRVPDVVQLGYTTDAAGLVGYWPLDEDAGSTVATDTSGTGNNGTYTNNPSLGDTGLLDTDAPNFDGTDDHVVVPDSTSLERSSNDRVTVSAWVNKDAAQSGWIAVTQHSDQSYNLQFQNGNTPAFTIYDSTWRTANSGLQVNSGQWYHLVGTFDGSTVRIYVNGSLAGTASASSIADAGGTDLGIGENLDATGRHLDGRIDEVQVYDRALSSSEVATLYNTSRNGTLTTDARTLSDPVDPTTLNLTNVSATVPAGTNLTVYVESDADANGTFESRSDPIALSDGGDTGPYSVTGLSADSADYRLVVVANTTDVEASPTLDGVTLQP